MMEKREGYKKTEIGWIPEDWVLSPLEEISDISMGQSPSSEAYNQENIGMPLIQGNADIKQRLSKPRVWTSQITKTCDVDDILMTVRAPVGAIANAVHNACIGRGVCSIKPMNADRGYLYQFLLSLEPKWGQIEQGSTFTAVNGKDVKAINITCPPLPEQKKIASILTTVDDKISSIEHQIQQTEQLKKGLMEKLLTEGIGHTEFKETKIGRIPKGWDLIKIGDIFEERKESSKNLKKYPLHSLTIESGLIGKTDRYERSFLLKNKDENLYRLVYPNDLLFNPMNLRFGAITISKLKSIVSVSAYYNILKLYKKDCDISYYDYLLASQKMINIYERFSLGSLVEKKRVHLSMFINFVVPIPPLTEQKQIATILSTVDDKIDILTQKKTHYQTLKKGLSQQLLTGQMRVKI